MRIIIPHIIMIAMILAFQTNALGGPVPEPDGDLVIQVEQKVISQECPEQGCLGEPEREPETAPEQEPEQEPEQALAATTPALTQVRLLVKPIKGKTPLMNYTDSVQYCRDMPGGEPFIPKAPEDIEMILNVSLSLGEEEVMWLPLDDLSTEGELRWSNGDDAMTDSVVDSHDFPWFMGQFILSKLHDDEKTDCATTQIINGGLAAAMDNCTVNENVPMICEMKMNISDSEQMLLEKIISLGSIEIIEDPN